MPALGEGKVLQKDHYPELFKTLLASLLKIFHGEQIGNVAGNPHPYPWKTAPVFKGAGFPGFSHGFRTPLT